MLDIGFVIQILSENKGENENNEKPIIKNGLSRAIKVIILCLVWYSASSASNIINKIVLNVKGLI